MAIYRSDQAQFTFAAEGVAGGAPERIDANPPYGNATTLSVAASKGDRTITVTSGASNIVDTGVKAFIVISGDEANISHIRNTSEIRRVLHVEGSTNAVLTLDNPLSFDHASTAVVEAIDATSITDDNMDGGIYARDMSSNSTIAANECSAYITWIPGIYDTVDVPDPVEAFEPRYMLGQNSTRNPYQIIKGQQTLAGSVAGITLINGWPLRFPLGTLQTQIVSGVTKTTTVASGTITITCKKGETWATITRTSGGTTAEGHTKGNYLILGGAGTATPTATSKFEIRKIIYATRETAMSGSGGNDTPIQIRVNYPFAFDHTAEVPFHAVGGTASGNIGHADNVFSHHIFDSVELDSLTWNINMKDENGENTFQRRYTGGKVGSMTLTAEEGGLLTCDWDSATFMNFNHNQQKSVKDNEAAKYLRRYLPMVDIDKTDVGVPEIANSLPTTNPYYFSEGTVKFFGNSVARVRTFSLTVANGEEPRYYIRDTKDDSRTPFEIKEGNREYSMTATIALPDAVSNAGDSLTDPAFAQTIWKELIMAGTSTAGSPGDAGNGMAGFDIELKFMRDGSSNDQITIRIPGSYDGSTATTGGKAGGLAQGAFINSATINVDGSNPMEQAVDIVFRDMKIVITDAEAMYP